VSTSNLTAKIFFDGLLVISLSILKALLTFLPAWLLSQLIRSLEQHPNSQSLRTISFLSIQSAPTLHQSFPSLPPRVPIPDIFYSTQALLCLALALASAVSGILASHLAYYELSRCSEPIKIQLRTLLFKKTLRRKDVVDLGGQDEDGNGSGGGGKSAILNLFTVDVARVATFGTDSAGVVVALVDREHLPLLSALGSLSPYHS
jgi:ABC-type multidrug transport system fused ATPase/permease subunit